MREFAEAEIVIPTGPFEGLRYSCERNPFAQLFFEAVQSACWRRHVVLGPSQSGKTLQGFVIPLLYHLFEVGETVICGLPTLDMVEDKWTQDILPVLKRTRYKDLLPTTGSGSRGGIGASVEFKHGPTLRFMTGGGGDKARAGFTSRVVVITETDGMDESGGSSREADKITQLEARTRSYGDRARIYMECTVSVDTGRTWQEYTNGTESRIAIRCQHCRQFVTPEREHLVGWQDCSDVIEAGELTRLACPSCGAMWTEDERIASNRDCRLVHKGQELTPECQVLGAPPRTDTLGFRWTAANNLLVKSAVIGQDEWKAGRAIDSDNAEKSMRQFVWALPYEPPKVDLTVLDAQMIVRRTRNDRRGEIPTEAKRITVGIDLGKYLAHWAAVAWLPHASPHVVEYGRLEVPSDQLGEERALLVALQDFRDRIATPGWPLHGLHVRPEMVFVDSGWNSEVVYAFCQQSGQGYFPAKGFGALQERGSRRETGSTVVGGGEGYQVVKLPSGVLIIEVNADHWKSWTHARLQTPLGLPGAMTLHAVTKEQAAAHLGYAKHLTAEKKVEEFIAGKGNIVRWEKLSRNNHWLDATCLAMAAGVALGERLLGTPAETVPPTSTRTEESEPYNPASVPKKW